MAYSNGTRLPTESASKLGHLAVIGSEWVRSLVDDFESTQSPSGDKYVSIWQQFNPDGIAPLRNVWATDGSFFTVNSSSKPQKEVAFVKTALFTIDKIKLDVIDKANPHPLLLQDILRDSAVFHATVFPLKNVHTSMGSNYDAIRHIVRDSIRIDEQGLFYETLKWLAYKKWRGSVVVASPGFQCPHCNFHIQDGLTYNSDVGKCPECRGEVYLTDMLGFHLDMDEDSAPDSVASSYMLIMELLMIFTAVRLLWEYSDKRLVSETLFIKDGPLTLRGQYSKLVPNIREFLQFSKNLNRPVHMIGQEKSGSFFDHLGSIAHLGAPHSRGEMMSYAPLTHRYIRQEVYRSPDLLNPYGSRTNWGEKVFVKVDPGTCMVINVPTGEYIDGNDLPSAENLIGVSRILATLPSLVSSKYEGALFPIELANGIASMSSYPSAKILQRFIDEKGK